jgi:UDP-N-acetylmuramate--alanine ligase
MNPGIPGTAASLAGEGIRRIHLIGVGGAGMSGLAEVLLSGGYEVTGCDQKPSPVTARLAARGLTFLAGHDPSHVEGCDLVSYTAAVKRDTHPETRRAAALGLPILSRGELLGRVMAGAKHGVAVAGTHGKTTTTAMVGAILADAGLDPTILVGGDVPAIGGNAMVGGGEYLVTEACEFENTFLSLRPEAALILNIDDDHLDFFKDIDGVVRGFTAFANGVLPGGVLVVNGDDSRARGVAENAHAQVETFGFGQANTWRAASVTYRPGTGFPVFKVMRSGRRLTSIELGAPGDHNVLNALGAAAITHWLGVDVACIATSLAVFRGVRRRFELIGRCNGAVVVDDYAHHPTAVRYALETARRFAPRRLHCVFQPHLFSRSAISRAEFVAALTLADSVILLDIFASREKDPGTVKSEDLVSDLRAAGKDAVYAQSHEEAAARLRRALVPGDFAFTMGAGDVDRVARLAVTERGGTL